jgi:hypothetical protein
MEAGLAQPRRPRNLEVARRESGGPNFVGNGDPMSDLNDVFYDLQTENQRSLCGYGRIGDLLEMLLYSPAAGYGVWSSVGVCICCGVA